MVDFGVEAVRSVVDLDLVLGLLSQPEVDADPVRFAWSQAAVKVCPALFLLFQTAVEPGSVRLDQFQADPPSDLKSLVWVHFLV